MRKVFVYWDDSNIFHEAQRLAEDRNGGGPNARYRVRIHFDNMLRLAHADRPLAKAVAAGSVPPEIRFLWNRLENKGVKVKLFDRGSRGQGEQGVPDQTLQLDMLKDGRINKKEPGIAVLLTGDGAGYTSGEGFHTALELMHEDGWQVEVLSWAHACNKRMREWAEENGVFVALDDYYDSITFLEPSAPGQELAQPRDAVPLDMSSRPMAK